MNQLPNQVELLHGTGGGVTGMTSNASYLLQYSEPISTSRESHTNLATEFDNEELQKLLDCFISNTLIILERYKSDE